MLLIAMRLNRVSSLTLTHLAHHLLFKLPPQPLTNPNLKCANSQLIKKRTKRKHLMLHCEHAFGLILFHHQPSAPPHEANQNVKSLTTVEQILKMLKEERKSLCHRLHTIACLHHWSMFFLCAFVKWSQTFWFLWLAALKTFSIWLTATIKWWRDLFSFTN